MTKKWIAITLLLFVVTGLLGWQLYVSVLRFNAENDLSKIQPVRDIKQKIVQDKSLPRSAPSVNRTPAEFAVVPENNVFSESRTREEKTDGAASLEPPPLTQKPILVGVSIVDNQKRASIIDPSNPAQGRNRRSQIKRIGDVYRGYTITDIAPNHIVLESGTRKEIIPLHEGSKRQQGGKTPILSTRVVSYRRGNRHRGDACCGCRRKPRFRADSDRAGIRVYLGQHSPACGGRFAGCGAAAHASNKRDADTTADAGSDHGDGCAGKAHYPDAFRKYSAAEPGVSAGGAVFRA